jgi:hypothetical protein
MDAKNLYETRTTFALHRLEAAVALGVVVVLLLQHLDEVRWPAFVALFLYIDVIGYMPGARAYRKSPDGRISRVYYVLYNTTHSMVTAAAVVAVWCLVTGPEWALLAVPLHLLGDRALFGNSLKSFSVPFEPQRTEAYDRFRRELEAQERAGLDAGGAAPAVRQAPTMAGVGR